MSNKEKKLWLQFPLLWLLLAVIYACADVFEYTTQIRAWTIAGGLAVTAALLVALRRVD